MTLYFITANKNKLAEVQTILPNVRQLETNLPEIQEIDPKQIIINKLEEAKKHHQGQFIVEDTSLYLEGMNGLPGPLIKWFLHSIGLPGIAHLTHGFGSEARAQTIIGYSDGKTIQFFEGVIKGDIVEPRGATQFGWDPIFQPEGSKLTFAEMSREAKNNISMRRIALNKLKSHLDS